MHLRIHPLSGEPANCTGAAVAGRFEMDGQLPPPSEFIRSAIEANPPVAGGAFSARVLPSTMNGGLRLVLSGDS